MRSLTVLLLIFYILFATPASSEIYTFIDSKGRLTYTSDPSILPEGHKDRAATASGNDALKPTEEPVMDSMSVQAEQLSQQAELAEVEINQKLNNLSEASAEEYGTAIDDILSLKIQMLELNEELIFLTAKNQEESGLRLQQLYKWAEDIDVLLESYLQTDAVQIEDSQPELSSLSVENIVFGNYSTTSGKKVNSGTGNATPSSVNSW